MVQQHRAVDIDKGVAMVVTDLHGEWPIYEQLRDKFLTLYQANEAQRLIICGDLVHGYGSENDDASLDMLLDVLELQTQMGADTVTMLLGNHELPHIYSTPLSKGLLEFTARFEHALARLNAQPGAAYRRTDVTRFLRSLPLYVRTKAGVMISHAGAAASVVSENIAQRLLSFDHDALLQYGDDLIAQNYTLEAIRNSPFYLEQAQHYIAVNDADDPRYRNLLRGQILSETSSEYALIWDALFTRNEADADSLEQYLTIVRRFLMYMSAVSNYEQRVIVQGHIATRNGFTAIGPHQLRMATRAHALPPDKGVYLLLDCEKPVHTVDELVPHLYRAMPEDADLGDNRNGAKATENASQPDA